MQASLQSSNITFTGVEALVSSQEFSLPHQRTSCPPVRSHRLFKKMPFGELSHFDEKSGVVACATPWGRWWQTVHEVHLEVYLPENTKGKEVSVVAKTNHIECILWENFLFKGNLAGPVHADETVWTIEDGRLLSIVLSKADHSIKDKIWESLLVDDDATRPDAFVLHEMRKKLDLERFQIENPGMDFSKAKLDKKYDNLPGWSLEKLAKKNDDSKE